MNKAALYKRISNYLISLLLILPLSVFANVNVEQTGELKKWHKVSLTFDGPQASENDKNNPFVNYRMNVRFNHKKSGKSYLVPGYFAADGNAANSGATSGNKWRVLY